MHNNDELSIKQFVTREELLVYNVPNTKDEPHPAGYDSALSYWCEMSKQKVTQCMAIDPHKKKEGTDVNVEDIVGAHVRSENIRCKENEAWIVPLCKHCNSDEREGDILLPIGVTLVPVKLSKEYPMRRRG